MPPALLGAGHNPEFYGEWLDSYFARDVTDARVMAFDPAGTIMRANRAAVQLAGGQSEADVLHPQPAEFAHAQAAGINGLDDRRIAVTESVAS